MAAGPGLANRHDAAMAIGRPVRDVSQFVCKGRQVTRGIVITALPPRSIPSVDASPQVPRRL